ncbi:creatininase family protein [Rhodococcus sp. NPDC079359]|uniref:creatininase family protein n=1 Tax=Rhodococcus sp. NPDC079359 TaxID=3154961 RepID=UPI00344B3B0F
MTSTDTVATVQAELMSPAELDAAVEAVPVAYLPLGTLEFHSAHLPIGLDALTAHGVCVGAAYKVGGIVLPPVYQGTGGGHSNYPWTVMMNSPDSIRSHLEQTLVKLESFGVRVAVVFTGHFADEQLAMIDDIALVWNADAEHSLSVLATAVNRCSSSPVPPDHAGLFETSLLFALRPDLVHLERLPSIAERPAIDRDGDSMGNQRHNRTHPLWGIFGPDPRTMDADESRAVRSALVTWMCDEVSTLLRSKTT